MTAHSCASLARRTARRNGDPGAGAGRRELCRGRRSGDAFRRSRRGQDDFRAGADPLSGGRSRTGDAKPDLHPDAGLRNARTSPSSTPISTGSKDPSELAELGWDEAADGALVLVEWAERAGSALTGDRLDIALFTDIRRGPDYRRAEITGHGALAQRLWRTRGAAERAGAGGLGRGRAPAHAGRRLHPRLRASRQAGWRKGGADDFAAASGRTLGPQRQAL